MRPVFLAGTKVGEFPTVTYQIPKLTNICRRDKTPGHEVVLEDIRDPLGVPLVRFLASDGFHIFGVSEDNIAGALQNVVNGNSILSGGFYVHILAFILDQPGSTPAQITGEHGKALAFVGRHALLIGRSNTGNDKGFVNIHTAADTVNDFEHNTSPRNSI